MINSYSAETWQYLKNVFDEAIELPDRERSEFLNRACADDSVLRAELERMILADRDLLACALESSPVAAIREEWNSDLEIALIGNLVGPFTLVRLIGSGGMGSVYEAVRGDETNQRVAVKLITLGGSNADVLRRFGDERKILALMEHPNIARFIDSGVTPDRIPYFAMEYVDGLHIDDYCRSKSLTIVDRLELFLNVCSAVSYAHRHLIIHRDLKPANILVNGDGEVKLLDFGIAKLTQPGDISPLETRTHQLALTPGYASPEQLSGEAVTTETDVYSLGVLLFELLTGRRPFLSDENTPQKFIRAVCEQVPPKPSSIVFEGLGRTDKESERTEARRTAKLLRGDLDNIVLKALKKDRDRRYESADRFAADIRAFLQNRPVTACRDAVAYRTLKFFQRNRTPSIAAALVVLSLCLGIIVAVHQTMKAQKERVLAERRFDDIRVLANKFIFEYHDRVGMLPGGIELRASIIRDGSIYLDKLAQDSVDDLSLQFELANAYLKLGQVQGEPYTDNLGDTAGATESYKKAVRLLEGLSQSRPADAATLTSLSRAYILRANLMARTGEAGYPAIIQRSVALNQRLVAVEPDNVALHAQLVKSYVALADYGGPLWNSSDERLDAYRNAFAEAGELLRVSPHDPDALRAMITCRQRLSMNLCWKGSALAERDGFTAEVSAIADEAVKHADAALETCAELERLDKPGYQTSNYRIKLTADLGLAMILRRDEKSVEVLSRLLDSAQARARSDLSNREARIDVALVHSYLGRAYAARHEWTGAIVNYRQSLLVFDEVLAGDRDNNEIPTNKAEVLLQLGNVLYQSGDYRSASAAYDRSEAISSPTLFLKSVLLNSARGDLEMSRAYNRLPGLDNGDDFTPACSRYQQALDSISEFDLKRDHIDHTFFSDVLERKLQACKNGSAFIAGD